MVPARREFNPLSPEISACAYPALAPPVSVRLTTLQPHPCPYLPDREAVNRALYTHQLSPAIYRQFMDANFRRSGRVIYQPVCAGCRACMSLRVPIEEFKPNKSQRRCLRQNRDLALEIRNPAVTDEKWRLYQRYQILRHGSEQDDRATFEEFLFISPVNSVEFNYRDRSGRLLAVGICDVCPESISTVYFFFDPSESRRGLGIFGALREIEYALDSGLKHYYLGYWVQDAPSMAYKAKFRPSEILHPDGQWRRLDKNI
jgi:arginine-tRNA-protein transferase